jgi:prolyl-tRNA synthetase
MPVEADTGVMGGKFSHEFMVPAETGENEVVYCEACGYAADVEKAVSRLKESTPAEGAAPRELERFPTPGVLTIDALTRPPYGVAAQRQIKTLVYLVDSVPVLILVRGDHQLNEAKLAGALGSTNFRPAVADEIFSALGAHPGSLGAVGVKGLKVYADDALRGANGMTTGANEDGFHVKGVDVARDIEVSRWADLRLAAAGEPCDRCGRPLNVRRAIEVGHVFKLGTKYSEALGALFLDEAGQQHPAIMGSYGIGVTRTLQAVIEQSHDKDGIIWPRAVAPFTVCVTPLSVVPESAVFQTAEAIYKSLVQSGVDVLLDDRDERPGVKFKDADLVGFPLRIGVGEKSLARGEVEIKPRGGAMMAVKSEEAVSRVLEWLGTEQG